MDNKEIDELLELLKKEKLSKEESYRVFSYYKETNDERLFQAIAKANDGLVLHLLNKYKGNSDFEDILQEGRIGLLTAIKKYDPELGYTFSTFASRYIKGYVLRYFEEYNPIHIPVNIISEMRRIQRIKNKNPNATEEDIAKELSIPIERVKELNMHLNDFNTLSLNMPTDEQEESTLVDFIEGKEISPFEYAEKKETQELVQKIIKKVTGSEKQSYIIKNIFGFGCIPKTYRAVAEELNVTCQRVNNVVNETIWKCRKPMQKAEIRQMFDIPTEAKDWDVPSYIFKD